MAKAQNTVGLISHTKNSYDSGYVLFSPMTNKTTYLIDKCGRQMRSWQSQYTPGLSQYLLPDGSLLRTGSLFDDLGFKAGGRGGYIERIGVNNEVMWTYKLADSTECLHHDIYPLPNGNILAIVWEIKSKAEAIAAGRDSNLIDNTIWSEKIIEIMPIPPSKGNIVWEWSAWDHLVQDKYPSKPNYGVVKNNPGKIDLNYVPNPDKIQDDWLHINSIAWNEKYNQIILSVHEWSEIWVIDHSTSTEDAAGSKGGLRGKGGELLYRWGNPAAYGYTNAEQKLFMQHNAHWIADGLPHAGEILLFNNGTLRPGGNYSSVERLSLPMDEMGNFNDSILPYLPQKQNWIYKDANPTNFYAPFISGAEMLKNGNVLICAGPQGKFFEIDQNGQKVWEYINPSGKNGAVEQGELPNSASVFRASFYNYGYQGLNIIKDVQPGNPIELKPKPSSCVLNVKVPKDTSIGITDYAANTSNISLYPNPATNSLQIKGLDRKAEVSFYNQLGAMVLKTRNDNSIDISQLSTGIYMLKMTFENKVIFEKLLISK